MRTGKIAVLPLVIAIAIWGWSPLGVCAAQEEERSDADVASSPEWTNPFAAEVYQRRSMYQAVQPEQIVAARMRARDALARLDQFFSGTSSENRARWREFLRWEGLEQELASDGVPSMARLAASYNQFVSGEPGLELSPFQSVRDELRTLLERLRLTESEPNRVAEERQRVKQKFREFERYLSSGGERKEQGWRRYLKLDELQTELDRDDPDSQLMRQLATRLESAPAGRYEPRFRRLAQAIRKYEEVRQLSKQPGGMERFDARMAQLAAAMEDYSKTHSNDAASTIVSAAQWLRQIDQHQDLVERLRNSFSRPNLSVWVSSELVERELQDRVCSRDPVRTCFEGANVSGIANSQSCIQGRLLPSSRNALIEIAVSSAIVTDSIAQKRRVYVSSESHTQVAARKLLVVTEDGLMDHPAQVTACTKQYHRGVCVDRRIGRRLISRGARRRAAESRYRAQNFTSGNTIQSVSTRLDCQSREMAWNANARIAEFKQRLRRDRLFPERVSIFSTATHLWLQAVGRDAHTFSTTTDPPAMSFLGDLGVQVHQSAVNNGLKQQLGGRKIDSDSVVEMLREYDLEVPPELLAGSTAGDPARQDVDEKWSLTFDADLPVAVTFKDGNAQIGIRGRKFSRGARQVNERIEISAQYRLLRTSDGYLLAEKIGDVDVRFVDVRGQLSATQMSYKVFLQRKFESLFRDQISTQEVANSPKASRLHDLMLDAIAVDQGWLTANVSVRPGVRLRPRS